MSRSVLFCKRFGYVRRRLRAQGVDSGAWGEGRVLSRWWMLREGFRAEVGLGTGSVLVPKTRFLFESQNGVGLGGSLAVKFVVRFWCPFWVPFWDPFWDPVWDPFWVQKVSPKGAQNGAHNVQVH